MRRVDEWGRVIHAGSAAFAMLYAGVTLQDLILEDDEVVHGYNRVCLAFDKRDMVMATPQEPTETPQETHARLSGTWSIPDGFATLDVRACLLARCSTVAQRERVSLEMDMFEARGLLPLLRMAMALVAHFREHGIVWGVGRGSSVASYCLFLIGLHKVDSLAYDIRITEFLKG